MQTRVLVDANVLYSRILRDWLIMIEVLGGPYKGVLERGYPRRNALPPSQEAPRPGRRLPPSDPRSSAPERGRVEDFVVDCSFPGDRHDRHVHAAALVCRTDIVLTAGRGFTAQTAEDALPYEVYSLDDFFVLVDDSAPQAVRDVAQKQAMYFYVRYGAADLCASLLSAG